MNSERELDTLFKQEEDNWQRYRSLLPEVDDVTLVVLKGHLIIEEMLNAIALEHCPYPEYFKSARLTFKQLSQIVRALLPFEYMDKGWEAIDTLNTLRNKLAHHLEPEDIERHVERLNNLCKSDDPCLDQKLETSARKAQLSICFMIGQLSVITAASILLKRGERLDLTK